MGESTKVESEALRMSRSTMSTRLPLMAKLVARFMVIKVLPEPALAEVNMMVLVRPALPEINSRNNNLRSFAERNAVNMPIQGTSADMIKIAMIRIYKQLQELGLQTKMILQVHDELVFDVYKPELDQVKAIVQHEMLNALPLSIPIDVSIDVGDNWLEAH